ncbi:MAG: type II CRISPR RNA-guided endonuclease Cas9 [Acidimicrobiaceae bacterium]|nr:type II CRISPR RNA-guided endonuclease Cas9 [Acidimicrobiaceae bacterium]
MIENELEAIREAQGPHHPRITQQAWDKLVETILFQRRLRPVERGNCTLLPDEKRIDRAHPLFQRFRIWQEVVNIRVKLPAERFQPSASLERALDDGERRRLVDKLLTTKQQDFDTIISHLGLSEGTRINLRTRNRERLDGDQTGAKLRGAKRFDKSGWVQLSLDDQVELVEKLTGENAESDHLVLVEWLQDRFGLCDQRADSVATARLPDGTGHLSKAAIERLLPLLEQGHRYDEAVKLAGLGHHSDRHADGDKQFLPYYGTVLTDALGRDPDGVSEPEKYGRIANPTVHIALGQVRRLFNAVAEEYGKPHEVVVELSRELKQNEYQRREYEKRAKENRQRNEELKELASKVGHENLSHYDKEKLRLWNEQGKPNERVCPFTGETLSIERVLSSQTDIEHLLPYSRSLDNSMNNKVVVMASANREKANRTPFEAWGHDVDRYESILSRAAILPEAKRWRFEEGAMDRWRDGERWLDRQLNETSYLSRLVTEYLEVAVPSNRIWVTPGRMTAKLRRDWGLESILSKPDESTKNREDHRHHLVDAVVIGMTSRSLLQQVARASGQGHSLEGMATVEPPWAGFRADVRDLADRCVVRHRPNHFTVFKNKRELNRVGRDVTSGALHNDTAYGIVWDSDGNPQQDKKGNFVLVETKPLDSLKEANLDDVRDRTLRAQLKELWNQIEHDHPSESTEWVQKEVANQAQATLGVRRVRLYRRVGKNSVIFVYDKEGQPYKAYKTDGNAYMDVWLLPNGKTRGEVVSRFKANQSGNQSEVKDEHPTARKLMRLHIDDMVAMGEGHARRILRVQKMSKQTITLLEHQQAGEAHSTATKQATVRKQATRVLIEGIRKVSVDVLGRVRDGGPFDSDGRDRSGET